MLKAYLKYRQRAKSAYGLHSPFVFQLYNEVIKNKGEYYAFAEIQDLRKQLLANKTMIEVKDLGAGSRKNSSTKRSIREITKNSASQAKVGKLLFRLVNFLQPNTILELGTSLGISSSYLAKAKTNSQIYSLEACKSCLEIAKDNFIVIDVRNIQTIEGDINKSLSPTLVNLKNIDLAFLDANHSFEATISYFLECYKKCNENSCIILDDIHWSEGMEKAWEQIQNMPEVSVSIDLFWVGLVFFRKNQAKEHFVLKF